MEERLFLSDEVEIYYVVEGEGQPLILCHGNGENNTIFSNLIPILSKDFRVYAMDSRGHGRSGEVDFLSYDDMANDILNLILHEQMDTPPIIIGFSDGGISALKAAIKTKGEAFSRMIIAGANLNPEGMRFMPRMIFKLMYLITKRDHIRLMLEEPHIDPEELGVIDCPVLVMAGQNDMIKTAHTKLIADSLKDSRLSILHGEQHSTYILNSKKFYSFIEEFLL